MPGHSDSSMTVMEMWKRIHARYELREKFYSDSSYCNSFVYVICIERLRYEFMLSISFSIDFSWSMKKGWKRKRIACTDKQLEHVRRR